MTATLLLTARVSVATVLVLSGVWKLHRRGPFESAVLAIAPGARALVRRLTVWPLLLATAAAEFAVGVVLGVSGAVNALPYDFPPAASIALVGTFTALLLAAPSDLEECGCGFASAHPRGVRGPAILRNTVLLALSLSVILLGPTRQPQSVLAPIVAGVVIGMIVATVPQIVAVAFGDRPEVSTSL